MVIEAGSFAGAARKLGTSRSRISEQVTQLEQSLGVRLLQRTTRQLSLTSEGQSIYEYACELPKLLECVNSIASNLEPSGTVSLAVTNDVAQSFVIPLLDEFHQAHPKIQLNLVISDTRSNLIEDGLDLAIRTSFQENGSLVARTLHREKPKIFASETYIKRHGRPQSLSDLATCHWLTLAQVSPDGSQTLIRNQEQHQVTPSSHYSCNSPSVIQQMLLSGIGVGCVLPSSISSAIESGQLQPIMPEFAGPELTMSLLYPSRQQVPVRTRCLIDFLLKQSERLHSAP